MISRQWRGLAKSSHADRYVEHLREETFLKLKEIQGFVSASILRRSVPNGVEFLIVTTWESIDAIHSFAGTDVETAVVPPRVQEMMVEYDNRVRHYQIVQ
jgi:heme-degrading monooxygenase HmoA